MIDRSLGASVYCRTVVVIVGVRLTVESFDNECIVGEVGVDGEVVVGVMMLYLMLLLMVFLLLLLF